MTNFEVRRSIEHEIIQAGKYLIWNRLLLCHEAWPKVTAENEKNKSKKIKEQVLVSSM